MESILKEFINIRPSQSMIRVKGVENVTNLEKTRLI